MTQAFNLSQLANNLNTSGQLDATDGLTGAVPVANGGTGLTTLTANNVILGNGTSAVQAVAPSTSGNVLTSNGTTWVSSAPSSGGVTSFNSNTGALNGWQKLAQANFSAVSSINLTGLSTDFRCFHLVVQYVPSGSDTVPLGFRYSTNNGSSYVATGVYSWVGSSTLDISSVAGFANQGQTSTRLSDNFNTTSGAIHGVELTVNQAVNSRPLVGTCNYSVTNFSSNNVCAVSGFSANTTSLFNAFQIVRLSGTGTLTGTYTLYGSK